MSRIESVLCVRACVFVQSLHVITILPSNLVVKSKSIDENRKDFMLTLMLKQAQMVGQIVILRINKPNQNKW